MADTVQSIIQRALANQLRRGADSLPSRSLGGDYIPSDMSNLNPTVGQTAGPFSPYAQRQDVMGSASPNGHSESIMADMARMAAMQVAARQRAGEQMISQVSAGSWNPISYPPAQPQPTNPYIDYASASMGSPIDPNVGIMGGTNPYQRRGA